MSLTNQVNVQLKDYEIITQSVVPRLRFSISVVANNQTYQNISTEIESRIEFSDDSSSTVRGPSTTIENRGTVQINQQGTALHLTVNLPQEVLAHIEKYRKGGGLEFHFKLWIRAERNNDERTGAFDISKQFRAGEWSEVLDKLGFHENRVVEINVGEGTTVLRDTIKNAYAYISQADEKYDIGDYAGSVVECRHALEALDRLISDGHLDGILEEEKRERADRLIGGFQKGFVGGLSHSEEHTRIPTALRRDSEFVLGVTKAVAGYIANAVHEEQGESLQ